MTIPLEQLPMVAEKYFERGESCRRNGDYKQAYSLFKSAAEKFKRLADQADSTPERDGYLHMQRECLRHLLPDAFRIDQVYWTQIMLEIKDITDKIK